MRSRISEQDPYVSFYRAFLKTTRFLSAICIYQSQETFSRRSSFRLRISFEAIFLFIESCRAVTRHHQLSMQNLWDASGRAGSEFMLIQSIVACTMRE